VFSTYTQITADARLCHNSNATAKPFKAADISAVTDRAVWQTLFLDEIGDVWNPDSAVAQSVRRLTERACVTVAASATPIFTSVLDVISIGRVIGMPRVVRRPDDKRGLPLYLPTGPDGTVLAGTEVAKWYVFTSCYDDIQSIAEKVWRVFNDLLKARRNVFKLRNKHKQAVEQQSSLDKDKKELVRHGMATNQAAADQ